MNLQRMNPGSEHNRGGHGTPGDIALPELSDHDHTFNNGTHPSITLAIDSNRDDPMLLAAPYFAKTGQINMRRS